MKSKRTIEQIRAEVEALRKELRERERELRLREKPGGTTSYVVRGTRPRTA